MFKNLLFIRIDGANFDFLDEIVILFRNFNKYN